MTCVICPTCGSQCSLGGVGETKYFIPPKDESERIADLERQLAEAKALLAVRIQESNEWEALARDRQAEVEAMWPVVDAARYHERSVTFYSHGTSSDPYHCDVCRAYKVYEARKQP